MKNWKDIVSNICGLIILLAATMATLSTQVALPEWVLPTSIVSGALAATVVSWLTGKNSDGSSKRYGQLTGK